MKLNSITLMLTLSAMTLTSTVLSSNPSHAEENTFFCGDSNGTPVTMAKTAKGNISVIRWTSDLQNSEYNTIQKQCEIVSKKFETSFRGTSGTLKYLTTGKINNQIVVCAVSEEKDNCVADGILFTLKSGGKTLQQLMSVSTGAANPANDHININQFLDTKSAEIRPYRFIEKDAKPNRGITIPNVKPDVKPNSGGNL